MSNSFKADYVTGIFQLGVSEDIEVVSEEVDFDDYGDIENALVELDRAAYENVRVKSALVLELIQHEDQVIREPYPARTRHEMNGGIKIAVRRDARLHEVEVFNLYFRFRSHLPGDGLALMYRSPSSGVERIVLLPDNTEQRIQQEQALYKREAKSLVFQGLMDSDDHSFLLENLNLLQIHERCAQTLQHEFGHVLHTREYDAIKISPHDFGLIYEWFVQSGYSHLVDKRYPTFGGLNAAHKLQVLKESFVEDYRISLNMTAERGKFILPNKYCFSGDFQNPDFLREGVELMKRMLNTQISPASRRPASSSDFDSIMAFHQVVRRRKASRWVAGTPSLTEEIIRRDLEELNRIASSEAASTK